MAIDSILANAWPKVAGAIRSAARSTGASFEYLLTAARVESNLNPAAQATTSSAKGLYRFIDQTWLATLKQAGPAHGYGQYANAITQTADGRFEVADPVQRAAIMRLRNDPNVSATMAGAFTQTSSAQLASAIGRQPSEGELYMAHLLGSDGAAKLIHVAAMQPHTNAAAMFPQAASANPSIHEAVRLAAQRRRGLFSADRPFRDGPRGHLCTGLAQQHNPARCFSRHRRRHAGQRCRAACVCAAAGSGTGGETVFADHVHRSRQPGGDAKPSAISGRRPKPMRRLRPRRRLCSTCSATLRLHRARRPTASSEHSPRLAHR